MPRIERIGAARSFTGAGCSVTGSSFVRGRSRPAGEITLARRPADRPSSGSVLVRLRDVLLGVLLVEQLVTVHDQRRDLLPRRVLLQRRERLRTEPRVALDGRVEIACRDGLQTVTLAVDRH